VRGEERRGEERRGEEMRIASIRFDWQGCLIVLGAVFIFLREVLWGWMGAEAVSGSMGEQEAPMVPLEREGPGSANGPPPQAKLVRERELILK
jgi:hypothetical protein